MEFELHLATRNDAPLILEMQKQAFNELLERYLDFDTSPANEPLEKVKARLCHNARYHYFVVVNDIIVGSISVTDKKDGNKKRLSSIFILPQFQGNGYAQKAIIQIEKMYGEDFWELETVFQENKLCYLYEKMGYRQTGKIVTINEKISLVFYEK